MSLTFEQLPGAIEQVNRRLEKIEVLLNHPARHHFKEDKLLRLPEAAEYCRMPVSSFRAHLTKRNVIGSKPGKHWLFSSKDLDLFIAKYKQKSMDDLHQEAEDLSSTK